MTFPQAFIRRQNGNNSEITETGATTSIPTTTARSTSLPSTRSSSSSSSSTSLSSSPSSSSSLSISVPASSGSTTSSTSSISATPTSENQGSSGIPTSTLIGAVVGGVIGLFLLLVTLSVLFTAYRRRRNDVRKRPRFSVVPTGTMLSKSKRPETVYDIDSFLGSKPFNQHSAEVSTAPLLQDGGRPSTAYESLHGVDEHGLVDRYTDRPPSPQPTSSPDTARHTEFPYLVSPYSTDGHGSDEGHRAPPSLSTSSYSAGATFVPLPVPPSGFSLMRNEQNNPSGSQAATSSPNVPIIPPPPPSSPSNVLS
ncbi:hypothetical protein L218DRAFT_954096 [Marasmius fiardii PR-910]|nr:hypothetical protein L218DRAFT_954096 [Marasmius fiardii PR-910]